VSSPAKRELDVDVEVTELDGGQVELAVRVPPEPVSQVRERVLKSFARRANIPGFRKGKAPRAVLERYIDEEAFKEQIIDALMEDAWDAALEKAGVKPLDRAEVREADLEDDGGLTFSATVTRWPEIELGDYRGVEVTRRITRVTDEQVEAELERVRSRRARFEHLPEDAAVEQGDLVVVDYEMFVDGEKREDASASGYPLEVGKDELFPELNEALPSVHPGETREVEISYPEDHSETSLAGKTAQFKVTVREARRRRLPELNDGFAQEVSDLETLEALRARVRDNLETVSNALADDDVRSRAAQRVADDASLDVPQALVDRETRRRMEEMEEEMERRGLTLQQHLQNMGRSFDDWRADIESDARQAARRALVLEEIGEREKLELTREEIEEEIRQRAKVEGIEEDALRRRLSESGESSRLVTRAYHRKIVQFLVDNAKVTEEVVEPEAAEEPESPGEESGE